MTCQVFDIIRAAVLEAGRPTEGELACRLWEWLSSYHGPTNAGELYRRLGYKPFCGYPLQRLDNGSLPL